MSRTVSLFDVIGPVMVGPSSSHTAGAVRLGQIGRAVLGAPPAAARLELHGSFALTGRGHGTDRALVAGLLGFATDDDRIRDSLALAEAAGLQVQFAEVDLGGDAHPNSVRMTLQGGGQSVTLVGASIGGGQVEVTEVQGYALSFSGEFDTLLIIAEDRPGTINTVTGWLGGHGINVAFLRVGRERRGGEAIMIVETDDPIPEPIVAGIATFPWVRWVRKVGRMQG